MTRFMSLLERSKIHQQLANFHLCSTKTCQNLAEQISKKGPWNRLPLEFDQQIYAFKHPRLGLSFNNRDSTDLPRSVKLGVCSPRSPPLHASKPSFLHFTWRLLSFSSSWDMGKTSHPIGGNLGMHGMVYNLTYIYLPTNGQDLIGAMGMVYEKPY